MQTDVGWSDGEAVEELKDCGLDLVFIFLVDCV